MMRRRGRGASPCPTSTRRGAGEHSEDLELATVLDALVADLDRRGRTGVPTTSPDLGRLLIDEYVRFPAPASTF